MVDKDALPRMQLSGSTCVAARRGENRDAAHTAVTCYSADHSEQPPAVFTSFAVAEPGTGLSGWLAAGTVTTVQVSVVMFSRIENSSEGTGWCSYVLVLMPVSPYESQPQASQCWKEGTIGSYQNLRCRVHYGFS